MAILVFIYTTFRVTNDAVIVDAWTTMLITLVDQFFRGNRTERRVNVIALRMSAVCYSIIRSIGVIIINCAVNTIISSFNVMMLLSCMR